MNVTSKTKKVQKFRIEKELNLSAKELWKIVGEDYGDVSLSHPQIRHSEFIEGSEGPCEGAARVCNFNESGSQYLKERMVDYDPEGMTFINKVYEAGNFPVDPEYTQARYTVKDLGNNKSLFSFDMQFRTKPAFLGSFMKGKFKKLIREYFISIEHYAKTKEAVNDKNFSRIRKMYA